MLLASDGLQSSTSLTHRATQRRSLRRKALVVGINYRKCGHIALKGAVNDAYLFALTLVNIWGFHPSNILLLTDELPSNPSYLDVDPHSDINNLTASPRYSPQRVNILQGLRWLISECRSGDNLVFFFAGHGLQLDNLSGWEGEGYDEAILPLDCTHQSGEVNAMTAVSIRQLLLSVSERVQLTLFLDCAGGQTMLDVAGTGTWRYIPGVIQKGLWPMTDATDKMQRAKYNSKVWTQAEMRRKDVRPRFLPGVEVGNTLDLEVPISASSNTFVSRAHAFLFAGAPFGQVSIEAEVPQLRLYSMQASGRAGAEYVSKTSRKVVHGAFTWALVSAMHESVFKQFRSRGDKKVSYEELCVGTRKYIQELRVKHGLPYIEQVPTLTHYVPGGSNQKDYLFFPFGGRISQLKYNGSCDPITMKTIFPYIPKRTEYCDAWRAEEFLANAGLNKLDRNESVKSVHRQLEGNWKRSRLDELTSPKTNRMATTAATTVFKSGVTTRSGELVSTKAFPIRSVRPVAPISSGDFGRRTSASSQPKHFTGR